MANTAFRGPIDIQKSDGTLVNFIDADGNLQASVDLSQIEDSNGNELLEFDTVASAVTYVRLANAATGGNPVFSSQGEADTGLEFHNDQGEEMLILEAAATAVNELTVTNAATGVAPSIASTGGDTNIDIALTAKGTGGVLYKDAVETVTATNVITAAESGKTFILSSATEFVSTLPAPANGLRFKFIVGAAPAGASYTVVTDSSANVIEGVVVVNGASVAGANEETITFADGAAVIGDWVEVVSDGTSWFVCGAGSAAGAITLTQAS